MSQNHVRILNNAVSQHWWMVHGQRKSSEKFRKNTQKMLQNVSQSKINNEWNMRQHKHTFTTCALSETSTGNCCINTNHNQSIEAINQLINQLVVWCSWQQRWSDQRSCSTPGPVSTGMGDCRVQLPVREIYLSLTNNTCQLSLAIPLWVGVMSTGQRGWCSVAGE